MFSKRHQEMVAPEDVLKGRATPMPVSVVHRALGVPITPPFDPSLEVAYFALGCFWGAERKFFQAPGVVTTAVGYMGGYTPNPTYEEVCSGRTGHAEAVLVVFDPNVTTYEALLSLFFESHDPTQGFRQGNDVGTQYRSAIYATSPRQRELAVRARDAYGARLVASGHPTPTTEIEDAGVFYYAEDYHQQYLIANPNGYCGLGGTGVSCPVGVFAQD
ncbi:MAG TPA: peptide-methionine (S)-S-oxide reductase MsrA [Acidimicrobiales bacterium]|jgi:peptide-methionine (S)-S-oxide reductase|nr:peptide-methionine (S)-S-oxide reductase MsrA [Acidimicrobiales bacterium]